MLAFSASVSGVTLAVSQQLHLYVPEPSTTLTSMGTDDEERPPPHALRHASLYGLHWSLLPEEMIPLLGAFKSSHVRKLGGGLACGDVDTGGCPTDGGA
mmetsp:Transcript_12759/g.31869  ORF Transcript_12759/g.31869 Transcript_12759/m.31869 type:complete len:99 (-) Transcript_12759:405-701(-)